jgi:hypothetical protein
VSGETTAGRTVDRFRKAVLTESSILMAQVLAGAMRSRTTCFSSLISETVPRGAVRTTTGP